MYHNQISKLASAIRNDIVGGLRGYHTNMSMSLEQLEDEIINTRLQILKEYSLQGILPAKDLYVSINCIDIDCKNLERCSCKDLDECFTTPTAHFEIPQIINDFGQMAIDYIGSIDKQLPFTFYTSLSNYRNHKYRKRGKNKPYVWIDTTPNENGMYDCFIFNAPLLKAVSITAIFKDPRQLDSFNCCSEEENISFINTEIQKRLVEQKLRYYRSAPMALKPNDQSYTEG